MRYPLQRSKIAFFTALLLFILGFTLVASISNAQGDIPVWTVTPTNFIATPLPTSIVDANFAIINNARTDRVTSLALNPAGLPVIAFSKNIGGGLALVRCNNTVTCDSPVVTTIDSDATRNVKMVLDGDVPVFVFMDDDKDLKLGRCDDAACNSPTLKTIETEGDIGEYVIALDPAHLPVIAYVHVVTYTCGFSNCADAILEVAHCDNAACDNPTITEVDTSPSNTIVALSLAIGINDFPVIKYNRTGDVSRMALCSNPTCTSKHITTIDPNRTGSYASIQLNSNEAPVIFYSNPAGLQIAFCDNNTACDNPGHQLISMNTVYSPLYLTLALDAYGVPFISFYDDFYDDLWLIRCADSLCTSAQNDVVDSYANVGVGPSLALWNGKPFVSYINATTGKVMLYIEHNPPPTMTPTFTPSRTVSPTPITPTSPANSTPAPAFFATRHPTLTWNPVSWATVYRIEIDDDPLFGSPYQAEVDAHTLTYTVEAELADGLYFWHVQAQQNDGAWGDWSARETIVVSAP